MDGAADELFTQVIAVALRRVDEIDPQFSPARQDSIDLVLRVVFPPLAAILPRADADDGDVQSGLPENSVFHDSCIVTQHARSGTTNIKAGKLLDTRQKCVEQLSGALPWTIVDMSVVVTRVTI